MITINNRQYTKEKFVSVMEYLAKVDPGGVVAARDKIFATTEFDNWLTSFGKYADEIKGGVVLEDKEAASQDLATVFEARPGKRRPHSRFLRGLSCSLHRSR